MAETLAAILPRGAVAVERGAIDGGGARPAASEQGVLDPVEEALIAGASERRRREFVEARACAREALAMLGAPAVAIPAAPDGAPEWPDGIVGSITHKGGYRAAAVAWAGDLAGLGIDAEPDERLPEGVIETIASPGEVDRVEDLLEHRPGVAWDRLLFSAKEVALKAAHPLGLELAGVRTVEVSLDADRRAFAATLGSPRATQAVRGRWTARAGILLAVGSIRPDAS